MTKTKFNSKVIPVAEAEPDRQLKANDVEFNSHYKFVDNYICTSKYTIFTFLPKNLFEQFQRVANIYFLCQIIIMSIPAITALKPESTAVPLFFVLAATAIKDAYDDIKRHMSDKEVNNRKTRVLKNGKFKQVRWMAVNVGDVIKVENNEPVPADVLLLSSSELNGMCFIETAELDGETNLKCKQPLPETCDLGDDEEELSQLDGEITCEPPNNRLDKYKGTFFWNKEKYSLDNDKIILRGCVARNTKWACGLVIFSGHDTKLMMNSGVAKFKRTGLDKLMNKLIIWIAFLLALICLFCSIMSLVWEEGTGRNFQVFLPWETYYKDSPILIAVMHWPAFIMVLNTLIPISLYISVEVIRLGHSLLINFDVKMYHPKTDTPAQARTTTLSEELGQIEYIFSDKTGTLTQNIMTFNKCSIAGHLFGSEVLDEARNNCSAVSVTSHVGVDFSSNPYADSKFKFFDQSLIDEIKHNNKNCQEFFRLLAVCHTVMAEDNDGELVYQAQSPDEGALVTAARNFGFVFKSRSPTTITISAMGSEEVYELLCILDFDNVRKRMSVIVRRNNQITLYCKGADTVIYERLSPASKTLQDKTTEHLNVFAGEGLRTLVLASRDLSTEEYDAWKEKQFQASVAMENRDELLDALYEEIETDLELIGATAVEDKLQDGVPETIATLAAANIKIWVLTGDKLETAINIGYSCQLLTDDMEEVFTIDGEDMESVRELMGNALDKVLPKSERQSFTDARPSLKTSLSVGSYSVKDANSIDVEVISNGPNRVAAEKKKEEKINKDYALVITGKSLAYALQPSLELDFLKLACQCKAVICCRVTPLQKALVVELVKKHKQAVTLAIGDGANDVSMIKAAHIGVGISGQEGMQAVLASDYSFAQFMFLQRLLLVHGRWSYTRMCQFLNYFFYKNFAFTLNQLWFSFFSGFSAQSLYDPWFISIYNVCFTSLPVLAMGIFDQDVNDENNIRYPKLYLPGQQNLLFNKKIFAWSLFTGTLSSICLFFFTYGTFGYSFNDIGLDQSSHQFIGSVVGGILVITVNLQCGMDTHYWTWINHFFIWGSITFYFCFFLVFYSEGIFVMFPQGMYVGVEHQIYNSPCFWLCCLLTATCCLMWTFTQRYLLTFLRPTLTDYVRWQQKGVKKGGDIKLSAFQPKFLTRRNSKRSGYAFAHQAGFGRVASGKGFYRRHPVNA